MSPTSDPRQDALSGKMGARKERVGRRREEGGGEGGEGGMVQKKAIELRVSGLSRGHLLFECYMHVTIQTHTQSHIQKST